MSARVCVIAGDGIGCEVVPAAVAVLQAIEAPLHFDQAEAGWGCFERTGVALPEESLSLARASDAILFGAVSSPSTRVPGYSSPIVALRRQLDLYACVRPVVCGPDAQHVDLIVLRENTEGLYAGRETVDDDALPGNRRAVAERVVTERASRRLARTAIELARRYGLSRITVVHKANVLRETCGLFREVVLDELSGVKDLSIDEGLVDSVAFRLAGSPHGLGVIVTTNLFGDILSDVAAVHSGGLGLVESISRGDQHALFEPVHGSAPDIAGTGTANPLASIRAAARMLEHLGLEQQAERVLFAVQEVITRGPHTPDLGGQAGTAQVTDAVIAALDNVPVVAASDRTQSIVLPHHGA